MIDDWRYSLRHSGCLYEVPDFFYGPKTFNQYRHLTYSYDTGDTTATDLDASNGNDDVSDFNTYLAKVHWVHVFNAHIKISNTNAFCDESNANSNSSHKCLKGDRIHQFAVVMANPTYEGLGFLNFVVSLNNENYLV